MSHKTKLRLLLLFVILLAVAPPLIYRITAGSRRALRTTVASVAIGQPPTTSSNTLTCHLEHRARSRKYRHQPGRRGGRKERPH